MIYRFYKVRTADIALIKFLLEAYENVLAVSTVDQDLPKIQITVAPDFIADAEIILADMEKRFFFQRVLDDETKSQGNY